MGARIFEGDWESLQEARSFASTMWETGGPGFSNTLKS